MVESKDDSATWRSNKTLVDTAGADTVDNQDDKEKHVKLKGHSHIVTEAIESKAKAHLMLVNLAYYNVLMQSIEQDQRVIKHPISQ